MPRHPGPPKSSIHVRVLDPTWENIEKEAHKQGFDAVPTFVADLLEKKFGKKS